MTKIHFNYVLKTTVTRTGTKIEHAMPRNDNYLIHFSRAFKPEISFNNTKIITFAKNSPLKKLEIDQALVGYDKQTGVRKFSFWRNGKFLMEAINNKDDIKSAKYFLDILKITRQG